MRPVLLVQSLVLLTPEYAVVEPEHIECGETCDECHQDSHCRAEPEAGGKYLVLGEESAQRPDSCNRETGHKEGDVGQWHVFAESAHGRHLVGVDCMDYAAGTEEEKCLEHRVCEKMEHGGHVPESAFMRVGGCADTQGNNHESYLRYCTEGKYSLYVTLYAGHDCRIKGGEGSHICSDMQDSGGVVYEQREHPCHKVDTCNDHCSRMDEGRHGSRALHGVRQPDVKREHCALAGPSYEHQSECKRKQGFGCFNCRCIRSE